MAYYNHHRTGSRIITQPNPEHCSHSFGLAAYDPSARPQNIAPDSGAFCIHGPRPEEATLQRPILRRVVVDDVSVPA